MRIFLSAIILVGFAAWVVWYIVGHAGDFAQLSGVPWHHLIGLYASVIASLVLNALSLNLIMDAFGKKISLKECFHLTVVSATANQFSFFRGGAGLRAAYLKIKHGLNLADFVSAASALFLMNCLISGLLGLIGMALLIERGQPFNGLVALMFGGLAAGSSALVFFRIPLPDYRRFPFRQISQVVKGWQGIRSRSNLIHRLLSITIADMLVFTIQTKLAFGSFDIPMGWGAVSFLSGGRYLVSLATITPGALGIQEAFNIYMGQTFNYGTSEALMVQAVVRMAVWSSLIVLCPWSMSGLGLSLGRLFRRRRSEDLP